MSALDFYAAAVTSGKILGVGAGSSDQDVFLAVGSAFEDVGRRRMRWDYGLIEFYFNRVGIEWKCFGVTIQVHRLARDVVDIIPSALCSRYGAFPRFLAGDELLEAIGTRFSDVVRSPSEHSFTDLIPIQVEGIPARIHLVGDVARGRSEEPGYGDVWSIELRAK